MVLEDKLNLKGTLEIYSRNVGDTEWTLEDTIHNVVTTLGFQTIANHLTNSGIYKTTNFLYFAWSNGTSTPAPADTAASFYADGTCATKAIQSVEVFDSGNLRQVWNCFLSSTDNTPASITKFALMNANPGTVMFNNVKFAAKSKTNLKEYYFRYWLTMSQV